MNKNLSSSVLFLFDNISNIDTVSHLNNKYKIFKSVNKGAASNYNSFINDIDLLKTASLKGSYLEDIKDNPSNFFNNHIDALLLNPKAVTDYIYNLKRPEPYSMFYYHIQYKAHHYLYHI